MTSTERVSIRRTGSRPQGVDALMADLDASIVDVADAMTLPPELYTSPDVLEFERDALYAREWLCVGRAERIPQPGDWFTVTICDEPIIVVRDKAGDVHACLRCVSTGRCRSATARATRRRSSARTTTGTTGSTAVCSARRRWSAPSTSTSRSTGCRRSRSSCGRASCSSTSTPKRRRSARRWPSTSRTSANYDLADAVCPGTFTLENLPWNWKVMFENFNDGYHANRLHQYVQDFCPSNLSEFPVEYDPDANVVFRAGGTPTSTAASTRRTVRSCRCSRS